VQEIQYTDDTFPVEYGQLGIRKLMLLKVYSDESLLAIEAIADRLVAAATKAPLAPLNALDLDTARSAWDVLTEADQDSHKEGAIAKTCFVFASQRGWDWAPYPGGAAKGRTIGAIAQQISGELGLRYEEIPYDDELRVKLTETHDSRVPTVLFGDP